MASYQRVRSAVKSHSAAVIARQYSTSNVTVSSTSFISVLHSVYCTVQKVKRDAFRRRSWLGLQMIQWYTSSQERCLYNTNAELTTKAWLPFLMFIYPREPCDHSSTIATCTHPVWVRILSAFNPAHTNSLTLRPWYSLLSRVSLWCVFFLMRTRSPFFLVSSSLIFKEWRNRQLTLYSLATCFQETPQLLHTTTPTAN